MEQIIYEIKNRFKDEKRISQLDIDTYLRLFREKGISVMALEEILCFFSNEQIHEQEVQEEAFVVPAEAMRTSYDVISQEFKELQYTNEQIRKRLKQTEETLKKKTKTCRLLEITLSCLAVIVLYLLII